MTDVVDLRGMFLPRDRGAALIDVTELLYERLRWIDDFSTDPFMRWEMRHAYKEQARFLRDIIDLIERS